MYKVLSNIVALRGAVSSLLLIRSTAYCSELYFACLVSCRAFGLGGGRRDVWIDNKVYGKIYVAWIRDWCEGDIIE